MARNVKVVSFSLPASLVEKLNSVASAKRMNRSKCAELALQDWMQNEHVFARAAQSPLLLEALMKAFAEKPVMKEMAKVLQENPSAKVISDFQSEIQKFGAGQREANKASARRKSKKKGGRVGDST